MVSRNDERLMLMYAGSGISLLVKRHSPCFTDDADSLGISKFVVAETNGNIAIV